MNFKTTLQVLGYLLVIIVALIFLKLLSEYEYQSRKTDSPKWELYWSDEFSKEGAPADSLWQYDLGDGCPTLCGWGNNELQYYTKEKENVRVVNDMLVIEAKKDTTGLRKYTSGRIKSRPEFDLKYGKVEVRLKNPSGRGVWPALWMLPTEKFYGEWPKSGEIDIMEHVGYNPDSIFGTVHTEAYNHIKNTQKGKAIYIPENESNFHVYSMEWNSDKLELFVDDQKYFSFDNEKKSSKEWPFSKKFHLIMNVAVGGNWGGSQGVDPDLDNMKMEIDYVRIYQDKSPQRLF